VTTADRNALAGLAALLLVLAFAFQGTRGLWEPDEGRYAVAGINMLRGGDWLVPTVDGEHPHLSKPPMMYWALALSFRAFGVGEWAARLPGALAFVCTGLFVFGIGRRLCAARPWLPAVVWSLSFGPFVSANIVSSDALLTCFETGAVFAFVEAWSAPPGAAGGWIRLMWLIWGAAFVTKGPPGLLPLLGIAVFLATVDRKRLRDLLDPAGLLLFAVVAFTWFAVLVAQDPARLQYFLGYEVFDRVFTPIHGRNAAWYGGIVAYFPALLVGPLPWSVLAVMAAGGPKAACVGLWARARQREPQSLLLLCWFSLPFAAFVLASSRLPLYVLPLFVPLSVMLARGLAGWPWLTTRRLQIIGATTALALLASKGLVAHWHFEKDARSTAEAIAGMIDTRRFDGITFVDMPAFYGLSFYLNRPTKAVPMEPGEPAPAAATAVEDLCSEIARPRRTLFAVKERHSPRFRAGVERCGAPPPVEIGRVNRGNNRIVLFTVPPKLAAIAG